VKRLKSGFLVSFQFICLGIFLLTGPFIAHNRFAFILELFSILLGLWAIGIMSNSKLSIFPDVRKGAQMITSGPYKIIRHPMYLAVILFGLSLLIDEFNVLRLVSFLVLLSDLIYKIEFEEKKLANAFQDYKLYRGESRKLIPFLY
jgi:protein-S-isoprenylcysteine O-methyltransferase Ste14